MWPPGERRRAKGERFHRQLKDWEQFVSQMFQFAPELITMACLLCVSAFCSASEAALFYLSPKDRREFSHGNPTQRAAARLLEEPDRLLTAVLFTNLVVNLAYFALASIVGIRLDRQDASTAAALFGFIALLTIILLSEMIPKSVAVAQPRLIASSVAIPMTALVRLLGPLLPFFQGANKFSRRVLFPRLEAEPYLEVTDLERAVQASSDDAALVAHERATLETIVSLSDTRVDEIMRPRTQFRSFRPPVSLLDLQGEAPPSGYVLITEDAGDEIASAVALGKLAEISTTRIERYAEEVFYVPWCAPASTALDELHLRGLRVAAVVNELGETIGIVTWEDLLETIFAEGTSRAARVFDDHPIRAVDADVWHVNGVTSLRRLSRYFGIPRPTTRSTSVAGLVQDILKKLPETGDTCTWEDFEMKVLDVGLQGQMLIELRRPSEEEPPA